MGFQQIMIIGNVGQDPEFSYTPQGIAVCKFSVAVSKVTGKGEQRKEKTTWFRVTVWRERAETAQQYIRKGKQVMIIGEVAASAYTSKKTNQPEASLEITASEFQFLGGRDAGDESGGGATRAAVAKPEEYTEDGSDLPF
jgi:single-strand DNA-binding protein